MVNQGFQDQNFNDLTQAQTYIHSQARSGGFALTKLRTHLDKQRTVRREDYRCEKGGKKRGEGITRKTSTRMTECPFRVRLPRESKESGRWQLQAQDLTHNHRLSDTPAQHTTYRKPTETEKQHIQDLTRAGVAPKLIANYLHQQNLETHVACREVYNARAAIRKAQLQGLTPIEALIQDFQAKSQEWSVSYTTDPDGYVNFFFARTRSIQLAQAYPEVILIDATYHTNRYNMPLLHFVEITAISSTFSIAFAFLQSETDLSYDKAVATFKDLVLGGTTKIEVFLTDDKLALKNALNVHYPTIPHLLYLWHINKNVLTKVQATWRVNTTSDEDNQASQEKRDSFMSRWIQASF